MGKRDIPGLHDVEEFYPDNDANAVVEDPSIKLNEAAGRIIGMLAPNVRELLVETAVTTLHIPLWQLVAGMVQAGYDMGLFTSPVINKEWVRDLPVTPATYGVSMCEYCQKPFQPQWPKQRFGTGEEHANCGVNFERERLAGCKPQHVVGGEHPLGEEPKGAVSSAVRPG